jgi:hypothetical protein
VALDIQLHLTVRLKESKDISVLCV